MSTHPTTSGVSRVEGVIEDTLAYMRGQGYSTLYLQLCRGVWRAFREFLGPTSSEGFSTEDINRYLESRGIRADSSGLSARQRLIRAVMRILAEFSLHGCYQLRRCQGQKVELPIVLQSVLDRFESFCRNERHYRPGTLRNRLRYVARFLHCVESAGLHDLATLCPRHIFDFMSSLVHLSPKTRAGIVSDLRSFLRFLDGDGTLAEDLSQHVPQVRLCRGTRIPSVWSSADVEAILAVVDRGSPKGKRDYAILMLACRLGLRVSDIRHLRLENLDWRENRLQLQQSKTGVPVTLPLTAEVGEAIIDYLRHGRAITDRREVFLRAKAPFEPFGDNDNLHHIITCYRQRAQVGLDQAEGHGMHALRHSVATRLLEVGTPLETIASVLGHLSLESTRIYCKVDIAALRTAALDLEVNHV